MKLIKGLVSVDKVDDVQAALAMLNIGAMTVTEVREGVKDGRTVIYRGQEYNRNLLPRMEVEVVVYDWLADDVVNAIIQAARPGETDGRVFVMQVDESYRIRTGEMD
jgi:nitrogen regulatory protein P-II 1